MDMAAERLDDGAVTQELGVVEKIEPELVVSTGGGRYRATRAVSCVIAPEAEDTVLVAVSHAGRAWVLAVLERPGDGVRRLSIDGDVELEAKGGHLRVQADEGVEVRSPKKVGLTSRELDMTAVDARLVVERLGVVGTAAQVTLERAKSVVSFLDGVFERVHQTAKRSYRFVEEMDVTRSKQIDTRAEETLQLRSKSTLMYSEGLTKVEGDQIHLG